MKTWLKGGLIFGWLCLLPAIYVYTSNYSYMESTLLTPLVTPVFVLITVFIYLSKIQISAETMDILFKMGIYLSVIFWFIFGSILGWIYGKLSRKRR